MDLYFECFAGISGDMTLAALNGLGVPEEYIVSELEKLGIGGFTLEFRNVVKNGITANSVNVIINETDSGHRHYSDIVKIIDESGIKPGAKKIAKDIFLVIARAEAKVHGKPVDHVHFHEVGALDSIVDIVGAAVCIDYLKPDRIIAGTVCDGHGFTNCQHGVIPVPVPAVVEIFAANGVKSKRLDVEAELVTPTGAGIIAAIADLGAGVSELKITKTAYGAGSRDLEIPNVLRVSICDSDAASHETAVIIETNIDNQTPESIAFALERLFAEGALDAFFEPIYMKKNRPAVKLTVICGKENAEKMCGVIFENTSTLGVRMREERRICLPREAGKIETRFGALDIKISRFGSYRKVSPEFESARAAAIRHGVPIDDVYGSVYESILEKDNEL